MNKRLIYAEDAIEAINGMPDCPNGYSDTYDKRHIIAVLEDVPSAETEHTETHSCDYQHTVTHGWIPVSDRLPEYGAEVLTINTDGDYEINHIIDEEDAEWFFDGVIAWFPLPEPYKEEQND